MNEILVTQAAPKTTAEYKAAIDVLLAEMQQINEKMTADQAAIDRLQAETRTIGVHTDSVLTQLGSANDRTENAGLARCGTNYWT